MGAVKVAEPSPAIDVRAVATVLPSQAIVIVRFLENPLKSTVTELPTLPEDGDNRTSRFDAATAPCGSAPAARVVTASNIVKSIAQQCRRSSIGEALLSPR
jgi:hypothetical protein